MKRLLLCAVISALSLSASATISQVQSQPNWSCSGTSCAATFTSIPATGDLVVVWTFWQSTTFTATAKDNLTCGTHPCNTYLSAVGPTLQPSASTPTSAQIFYAKDFQNPSGLSVMVTVTFTGTVSLAGMVIVEYSGLDQNYPLDSVSAGYSTALNPTSLLDSGTVAPANSNLLVFAGGISDGGTATPPTGFSSIQSHSFSAGSAITEQNTNPIAGNNVLQRATACLTTGPTCPTTPTGNWLMQMAVFRDASWTVSGAWSPVRIKSIRYADQFPGVDIGDQINHAAADCPPSGCVIHVAAGNYSFSTQITLHTGYPLTLVCDPGGNQNGGSVATTLLNYVGQSGTAITFDASNGGGIEGCTVISSQGPTYSTIGISITSAVGDVFSNVQVGDANGHGFHTGLQISTTPNYVFLDTFFQLYLRGNATNLNFPYTGDNTTNENISFVGGVLSDAGTVSQTCATLSNFEMHFYGVSFDGCPITIAGGGNTAITFDSDHFEATLGGSDPFVVVNEPRKPCSLTFVTPNFVTNSATPSSLINVAGSGMYDVVAPKALASSTNSLITSNNNAAYVLVENPNLSGVTYTIDPSSGTHYGAANDIEHGVFLTGTQNCAFRYGLGTITGCQSFATLNAARTWTFPNLSGTVGISGNSVTGFYQSVKNTVGCTTGSGLGNGCASGTGVVTVTWPTAFADASYSVTCTGSGALTGTPGPVYIVASTKLRPQSNSTTSTWARGRQRRTASSIASPSTTEVQQRPEFTFPTEARALSELGISQGTTGNAVDGLTLSRKLVQPFGHSVEPDPSIIVPGNDAPRVAALHAAESVIADIFVTVGSVDKKQIDLPVKWGEIKSCAVPEKRMYPFRLRRAFEKHASGFRVPGDVRPVHVGGW
jgi:hypothetical protein